MSRALYLLCVLAFLGAADTLYYHEWRAQLPCMGKNARSELLLHAFRDFVYSILFITLPWIAWQGAWAITLAALLLTEIVLTLWDFVVEDWVRKPLGGLYPGERVMHAVMGILYGAMLAFLGPSLWNWWAAPTGLAVSPVLVISAARWALSIMGIAVLLSGVRDLSAAYELPGSAWPWIRR